MVKKGAKAKANFHGKDRIRKPKVSKARLSEVTLYGPYARNSGATAIDDGSSSTAQQQVLGPGSSMSGDVDFPAQGEPTSSHVFCRRELISDTIPKKKARAAPNPNVDLSDDADSPETYFPITNLPFELLAEVLIFTGSSQHVLAMARTCKFLCHFLLAESAQFIWRQVRQGTGCAFEVRISSPPSLPSWPHSPQFEDTIIWVHPPDPPVGLISEAAYAAFLYDLGPCGSCGSMTSNSYASFALRIRACKSYACKRSTNLMVQVEMHDPLHRQMQEIHPVNERGGLGINPSHTENAYWPWSVDTSPFHQHAPKFYMRQDSFEVASQEYAAKNDSEEYQKKFMALKDRNTKWMEFCVKIAKWKTHWDGQLKAIQKLNRKTGQKIAEKFGWEYNDMNSCPSFGESLRLKTKLLEIVSENDIDSMRNQIELELLGLEDRRGNRKKEISLRDNRADIQLLYNRLVSKKAHKYMPSLYTFRHLPIVHVIQSGPHEAGTFNLANSIQNTHALRLLLDQQLEQWVDKAKQELAEVLGFPENWRTASNNVLHPVERITARFLCKKCGSVERKYRLDGCLDFAGACSHMCDVGNNNQNRSRKQMEWKASKFVKDEKAINSLKQSLQAFGYAEEKEAGLYLSKLGLAIICNSCDPPMVLDSRGIVGHSHRHDDTELSFTSIEEKVRAYLGRFPYEFGLVEHLMRPGSSKGPVSKQIDKKNFGCRHCLREQQIEQEGTRFAPAVASNTVSGTEAHPKPNFVTQIQLSTVVYRPQEVTVRPPLFSFNGLRSHVKSKHGIEDIRDEDVFCLDAVPR